MLRETIYVPLWNRDLVRSFAGIPNVMPSSPSEVKLNTISSSPLQQTANVGFNTNGLIGKTCQSAANINGNHSPTSTSSVNVKTSSSPPPTLPPLPAPQQQSISHVTQRSLSNTSDAIGSSSVRQISKLKRFLTTLYQFATDISTDIGERVRALIIGLVNSTISIEEFHQKIQESTNYPLRPYVIPFLKLHLPILQTEIVHYSRLAKISSVQYLREHESLILDSSAQTTNMTAGEPFEIFQPNEPKENHSKRRPSPEMRSKENGYNDTMVERGESSVPPAKRHQPLLSPTLAASRISPSGLAPLLLHTNSAHSHSHSHSHHANNPSILHSHLSASARSMFDEPTNASTSALYHNVSNSRENTTNGRTHSSAEHLSDRYSTASERFEREYCRPAAGLYSGLQRDYNDDRDMEDEWKNIHTMLNCILGMVEKTKRALAILQHRNDSSRSSDYGPPSMWNMSSLRARHFNPMEVSSHSAHEFHEIKKPRVDNLLSTVHFQKSVLSEIDKLQEFRRNRSGTHQHLEDAVSEVKRQAMAELQKAVTAAENKANELVATERSKIEKMISDARRQAAEEALTAFTHQDESTENCWNCGRKASETCSGCNIARYCGSFCQHKDWENHHRVCQNTSNGSVVQLCSISGEKRSKSRSPTPASITPASICKISSMSGVSGVSGGGGAGDSKDNKKNE